MFDQGRFQTRGIDRDIGKVAHQILVAADMVGVMMRADDRPQLAPRFIECAPYQTTGIPIETGINRNRAAIVGQNNAQIIGARNVCGMSCDWLE
jgi:hypothetical protein